MHFDQPIGFSLGKYTVGNSATMEGCLAIGTIVDVFYKRGLHYVTLEFMRPQSMDVPGRGTSHRFDLPCTAITSTWDVAVQPDLDGCTPIGEGSQDGCPALVWGRAGSPARGEPSFVTEVRAYVDEVSRQKALHAWQADEDRRINSAGPRARQVAA